MDLLQTVNAFYLEGDPVYLYSYHTYNTYENELLCDADSFDFVGSGVLGEVAVTHKGIGLAVFLVIHVNDEWVVVVDRFEEVEGGQVLHVELTLLKLNLLPKATLQHQLLHVVLLVWRVQHGWYIVYVSLLIHAHIHSHNTRSQRIHLKGQLQLVIVCHVLQS